MIADPEVVWRTLNLGKCTALETLAIYVNIDFCPWKPRPVTREYHSYWEYVEIIFEDLPSSLRRVELALEDREEPEWIEEVLHEVDWKHIQRALNRLPHLEKVVFHAYNLVTDDHFVENHKCPLDDMTQDLIRRQLPLLESKNLLDFMGPRGHGAVVFD